MKFSSDFFTQRKRSSGMVGIVLALEFATGVLGDSLSLFNPDPGAPVSVYNAGVTNGVTTYLLGCNASVAATGRCDFTAPITMIEGPSTFHVEVTTWLMSDKTQSFTLDCSSGTARQCSMTALNSAWQTTTLSLSPLDFSTNIIAIPTVASPQALLYNGVSLPTASATTDCSSISSATLPTISESSSGLMESTISSSPTTSPNAIPSQVPFSKPRKYAWIAGAVIAPLLVILLIIAGLFYRQKKKIGPELEAGQKMNGGRYQKPELHGDSLIRPQFRLDGRLRSELPAREPAASELF
ncbi:hypothetical protein N431DRAFT_380741 [Stipitochalara longipes BDJ]|nr:hypothetical protein N431DRAFT_380741 [Stipitochalara longipes BDJ]